MDQAVIPAPARFEAGGGPGFAFRLGTVVAYADARIAPVAGRFCAQVARRTGLRLAPVHGGGAPDEPYVTIEPAGPNDLGGLPAPAGLSPAGNPAGESYLLMIEDGRVVLRAAEPAGVARGLTTLIQLVATASSSRADGIRIPCARILDAPRYAWRGLSLDVARTFFTVEEIRRVIDLLELYKLNVLHLHLTDDPPGRRRPQGLERPAARQLGRPPRPPRPARQAVGPGRPHLLPRLHRGLGLSRPSAQRLQPSAFSPAPSAQRLQPSAFSPAPSAGPSSTGRGRRGSGPR